MQEQIAFLLIGWALGVFSPLIVHIVTQHQESTKVQKALKTELQELRYLLTIVVYMVKGKYGTLNKETLEWINSTVSRYNGALKSENLFKVVARLSSLSDAEITAASQLGAKDPQVGLSMKTYAAPLLDESLRHLSSFNVELQAQLLQVRAGLSMFNEEVNQSRFYFELTFNPEITGANRDRVEENLNGTYNNAASRAKIIADQIGRISW